MSSSIVVQQVRRAACCGRELGGSELEVLPFYKVPSATTGTIYTWKDVMERCNLQTSNAMLTTAKAQNMLYVTATSCSSCSLSLFVLQAPCVVSMVYSVAALNLIAPTSSTCQRVAVATERHAGQTRPQAAAASAVFSPDKSMCQIQALH